MKPKYEAGQKVNARICNTKMGQGTITFVFPAPVKPMFRDQPEIMYGVQIEDGNYPIYEEELVPA